MINTTFLKYCFFSIFVALSVVAEAQNQNLKSRFDVLEYNVENLFDCVHDTLKDDNEYLPDGLMLWTRGRYRRKTNNLARAIIMAGTRNDAAGNIERLRMPALIGLCEVENDNVMIQLTRRSPLRNIGYKYVMTDSPDQRGVDVALMYQPAMFRLDTAHSIRISTMKHMKPTRDILYARGKIRTSDSIGVADLHVFVVHAPSRSGGEYESRPFRMAVARRLCESLDSVYAATNSALEGKETPLVLVMGDFNDYTGDASIKEIERHGVIDISAGAVGETNKKVKGTYSYQREWGSLDHIFVSPAMREHLQGCVIVDHEDLLEESEKTGVVRPKRFMRGSVLNGGFSDHLPLLSRFQF